MPDLIGKTGLEFFASVIASISHEIKNRIAVINEQAGLLDDLLIMHGQGREMSPERLQRVADSVKKQVAMADGIVINMNRFAHTVDTFRQAAAVDELIRMAVKLAGRKADMCGVHLEIPPSLASVTVETSPFFLIHLIWVCISAGMEITEKNGTILLSCEKTDPGASLEICMRETNQEDMTLPEHAAALAELLDARLLADSEKKQFIIRLPAEMGQNSVL